MFIVAIFGTLMGFIVVELHHSQLKKSQEASSAAPETTSQSPVAQIGSQKVFTTPYTGPADSAAQSNELTARAASPNPTGETGDTNEPPLLPPATVLDKARVVIHNYRTAFGQNPVGTNPEITEALSGKNSKSINFVAESGLRVNGNGEMLDGFGTPFFFHQISGQEMEIRSAGPDRVMWTFDDAVTK